MEERRGADVGVVIHVHKHKWMHEPALGKLVLLLLLPPCCQTGEGKKTDRKRTGAPRGGGAGRHLQGFFEGSELTEITKSKWR